MKQIICDKCKDVIKLEDCFTGAIYNMEKSLNFDLCENCANDVANYIHTTFKSNNDVIVRGD